MKTPRLYRLHRLVGLAAAGFLVLFAATGMLIPFKDRLLALTHPRLFGEAPGARPADLDTLVGAAAAAVPGGSVIWLRPAVTPGGAVTARVAAPEAGKVLVVLAPDAALRGVIDPSRDPVLLAVDFHGSLLLGNAGHAGVMVLALPAIGATLLGLWLWLRIRVAGKPIAWRRLSTWHRGIGAMATLPLLLLAMSGLVLAALPWMPETPPPPTSTAPLPPLSLAATAAGAAFPEHRLAQVNPGEPGGVHQLRLADRFGRLVVVEVAADGIPRPEAGPAGLADGLTRLATAIHGWTFLGALSPAVTLLLGLLVLAMGGSGVWMWVRRRPAPRRPAAARR
ncbi:MAG TPA: PepSY domain-containing protein [Azospirillaceae bacterium]|nr:PepSY domain-containing protein [Azospirillaceae bacterium]